MEETPTSGSTLSDVELYKIALATRNFEIDLFWKRSNYFLVLNSGLALGFFKVDSLRFSILLGALGLTASILWFLVTLGGKFWQCRWEFRLRETETIVAPNANFFSVDAGTLRSDVQQALGTHGRFRRQIDRMVLTRPSVSFMMTLLSITFIVAWAALILLRWLGASCSDCCPGF